MSRESKYITVCDRYGRPHTCETPTGPVPPSHRPATDKQILLAHHMSMILDIDVPAEDSVSVYRTFISNNMPDYAKRTEELRDMRNRPRRNWIPRGDWPYDPEFEEGWGPDPEY